MFSITFSSKPGDLSATRISDGCFGDEVGHTPAAPGCGRRAQVVPTSEVQHFSLVGCLMDVASASKSGLQLSRWLMPSGTVFLVCPG